MGEVVVAVGADESGDRTTPDDLFKPLNELCQFELDAAASHENAKCVCYYTKEDDGLAMPWHPFKAVFVNPPYDRSELIKWVEKAYAESSSRGTEVVMILPADPSTKWFRRVRETATMLLFPDKRYKFDPPNKRYKAGAKSPTLIALWCPFVAGFQRVLVMGAFQNAISGWVTEP